MVKALGVDPGTKSFDLALIEGPRVVDERSIDTSAIARDPRLLIDAIEDMGGDVVAAPSGYGVPPTWLNEVKDPHRFAVEVLLLSTDRDIDEGVARGDVGAFVYRALALVVEAMKERNVNAVFIPSIVLLPTVPPWRKVNKIDMGTADKLAVAALGVYDQSRRLGLDYGETSFVLVELGFGYNAVIGVEGGRVIDAEGGTTSGIGFLTSGPLDAEVVVAGREWRRVDVFHGGVVDVCRVESLDKALEKALSGDEACKTVIEAYLEGVVKSVARVLTSFSSRPREILLSGRYSRIDVVFEVVAERLRRFGIEVRRIGLLDGARISKEAAQGYAIVGEGLSGGYFSKLVKHMGIDRACGTTLSWVVHPRVESAKKRVLEAYIASVANPRLCSDLGL